jgi:choline kinase
MKAILLAAGLGSRLGPMTRHIPKAVIDVGQKPLILRVLKFTKQVHVNSIVVVGGYNSQELWAVLKDEKIHKPENPHYRQGNLYSLEAARKYLDDDFVIMNIDHLYPTHLARMISETGEGIWAVCDFDRPLFQDDMKVSIRGRLNLDASLKAISKGLNEYDGGYCGITVVRGKYRQTYLRAMDHILAHGRDQAVVEDVLAELIQKYDPPKVLDISGIRWLEIDTQEDLANAERILRMKPHFLD